MGQTVQAILAYGYNLGGDGSSWEITEVDEYDCLDPARITWYDEDDEDGFVEQAEKHLLAAVGFTETWETRLDDEYFAREREAKKRLGVIFETHESGETPQHVLATKVITVDWGDCEVLDLEELTRAPAENGWNEQLRAALKTLGITPKHERPRWVLCAYKG